MTIYTLLESPEFQIVSGLFIGASAVAVVASNSLLYYKLKRGDYNQALKDWSLKVRKRDKRCLICGSRKELHAHHLFDKSTYPIFSLQLWNGRTMCKRCHMKFHEWKGGAWGSCTPIDYYKFKALVSLRLIKI